HRVAHTLDAVDAAYDVGERFGADVAGGAVADAVSGEKAVIGIRTQSMTIVAEPELRGAVALDLDDEMRVVGIAAEQVPSRLPSALLRTRIARQCDRRDD